MDATMRKIKARGPIFVRILLRFIRRNNRALGLCAFIADPFSPLMAVVSDKGLAFPARAQPNQMARLRPDLKA
jgi:hypothetical protein